MLKSGIGMMTAGSLAALLIVRLERLSPLAAFLRFPTN
jgi:hypothetical protein